jgi:hypothetical protein
MKKAFHQLKWKVLGEDFACWFMKDQAEVSFHYGS